MIFWRRHIRFPAVIVFSIFSALSAVASDVDQVLQREVVREIWNNPQLDVVELEVTVEDGIVSLSGRVATSAEKHLASRYADDVPGTQGVVNLIEVVPGLRQLD